MLHLFCNQYVRRVVLMSLVFSGCANERNSKPQTDEPRLVTDRSNAPSSTISVENTTGAQSTDTPESAARQNIVANAFELPVVSKVEGQYLKIFAVALTAFNSENKIPENKRDIRNYAVELRENREFYLVYFSAHSSVEDKSKLTEGGETSLGKSVMFVISKGDLSMQGRYFFK